MNKIDITTEKAIGVRDANDKLVWFPRSQVDYQAVKGGVEITLPKWLADKNDSLEYEEE